MILGFSILFCFLTIVPLLVGKFVSMKVASMKNNGIIADYICGITTIIAIFQILCVPFTFLRIRFTVLCITYGLILLMLCTGSLCIMKNSVICKERMSKLYYKNAISWTGVVAFLLIILQMLVTVLAATTMGLDDAAYLVYSLDTIDTDYIFNCSPYLGTGKIESYKMLFTSWCIFISFLSKISGIHVTIIAHNVIPIFFIPIAYSVYYMIGNSFFRNGKSVNLYMIFLNIIIIFSGFSVYTLSFRLNITTWQGKAVAATILFPYMYLFLQKIHTFKISDYIYLFVIFIAIGSTTLMAYPMAAVMICSMVVVYWRKVLNRKTLLLLCVVLLIMSAVAALYIKHYSFERFFTIDAIITNMPKAYDMMWSGFGLYWSSGIYLAVFAICILYCYMTKAMRIDRRKLVSYIAVVFIIMCNPIFVYLAYVLLKVEECYVRMFWIVPDMFLIAYVFAEFVENTSKKAIQYGIVFLLSSFLVVMGENTYMKDYIVKAENIYKIPQEVVEICEIMNQNSAYIKIISCSELLPYYRQYDSNIKLFYGRGGAGRSDGRDLVKKFDDGSWDAEEIFVTMQNNICNFVVFRKEDSRISDMQKIGLDIVGQTDNYSVLYYKEYNNKKQ